MNFTFYSSIQHKYTIQLVCLYVLVAMHSHSKAIDVWNAYFLNFELQIVSCSEVRDSAVDYDETKALKFVKDSSLFHFGGLSDYMPEVAVFASYTRPMEPGELVFYTNSVRPYHLAQYYYDAMPSMEIGDSLPSWKIRHSGQRPCIIPPTPLSNLYLLDTLAFDSLDQYFDATFFPMQASISDSISVAQTFKVGEGNSVGYLLEIPGIYNTGSICLEGEACNSRFTWVDNARYLVITFTPDRITGLRSKKGIIPSLSETPNSYDVLGRRFPLNGTIGVPLIIIEK